MRSQELVVACLYTKETETILEIIQSSFDTFLKRELHNVANHLPISV